MYLWPGLAPALFNPLSGRVLLPALTTSASRYMVPCGSCARARGHRTVNHTSVLMPNSLWAFSHSCWHKIGTAAAPVHPILRSALCSWACSSKLVRSKVAAANVHMCCSCSADHVDASKILPLQVVDSLPLTDFAPLLTSVIDCVCRDECFQGPVRPLDGAAAMLFGV